MTTFSNGESGFNVRTKINAAISDIDRVNDYLEIVSSAGTTTLTSASSSKIRVTGVLGQTIILPVASTLYAGWFYIFVNDSTASITVQSSGLNTVRTVLPGTVVLIQCILATGTTAASWLADIIGFSSTLPVDLGGTNIASYAVGDLLFASAATTIAKLADVATGNVLLSGGVGVAPSYGKVGLTTHVSGTLGAANGGTGNASYAVGDILFASGATALSKLADVATGNVLLSGGVGVAPSYGKVGLTTHVSGTLPLANGGLGVTSAPAAAALLMGYTSTATAAGTTVLTNASSQYQLFTGVTTQTITLPVTSTLGTGWTFHIVNNSTGNLTVNSSGGNLVATVPPNMTLMITCIGTTLTTAADWEFGFTDFGSVTGTGAVVLATSPAISGGSIDNATVGATTPASVTGSLLASTSVITDSFATRAAGTLALAFATNGVVRVTPNATGTFTTTVPPAGTRCTLIVLTSGATSFTMTFGTGFKTTGTLATGTVTARHFVFNFVSDGTSLIESSRTVAIA
jgi:hypothetical protein